MQKTDKLTTLPGGGRNMDGDFVDVGNNGIWWTSSKNYRAVILNSDDVLSSGVTDWVLERVGFSVRCIKD
jgi:hypothetical protein